MRINLISGLVKPGDQAFISISNILKFLAPVIFSNQPDNMLDDIGFSRSTSKYFSKDKLNFKTFFHCHALPMKFSTNPALLYLDLDSFLIR